jgi:hypothetical protein
MNVIQICAMFSRWIALKAVRLTHYVTRTVLPGLHLYFLYLCLRGRGWSCEGCGE